MDPFTQRMLEKAEQRSRALGISNASQFPLAEATTDGSANVGGDAFTSTLSSQKNAQRQPQQTQKKLQSHSTTCQSSDGNTVLLEKAMLEAKPSKPLRHYAAVNKENMDLGIEINITTDKPIGVQVEIQEQDVSDSESGNEDSKQMRNAPINPPLRDTSRNRLQRLGALYSNTADLSSPIHRTEEQFHAGIAEDGEVVSGTRRPKQRLGKLAALADTINQWEDDTAHHELHRPLSVTAPPKPELASRHQAQESDVPKKQIAPQPPVVKTDSAASVTKHLKWDPKVISSLEAQGFQRRESSTLKHTYDYKDEKEDARLYNDADNEKSKVDKPLVPEKKSNISQVAKTFTNIEEKKSDKPAPKSANVKSGLVSGRAAIFENKVTANREQSIQRPQKDPCELSLKERMKLFESSNSKAILPKAPIGTAPSLTQIRSEQAASKQDEVKIITPSASSTSVAAPLVKPKADNKLREKVAALVANAQSSAESRIKDIDRQRQEDMQIIANRFTKQKELLLREPSENLETETRPLLTSQQTKLSSEHNKVVRPMPPPPPPPTLTASSATNAALLSSKRRSPGDVIDEETKRARTSNPALMNRLYPTLSDLDSSDDNCCATVTASVSDNTQQDDQESYMDDESDGSILMVHDDDEQSQTEDSSAGMCNVSLGREVMQVVCNNEATQEQQNKKAVRYAEKDHYFGCESHDSSMNSSSVASMGIDDYLDEALDDNAEGDEDDESDYEETSRASRDSKGTTTSNSFSFRKTPGQYIAAQTIDEDHEMDPMQTPVLNAVQPVKSELSVNQDNDNLVTLVHTVSFYRRQQSANSANSTPVRKICREQQVMRSALDAGGAKHKLEYDSPQQNKDATETVTDEQSDDDGNDAQTDSAVNDSSLVQDKIKKLLDEVCKQQQVIGQTSQALNLCAATIEFSGSTESVEGERYLLLATHRRQACLDEVQRLRVEKSLRPLGAPKEKGMLTVKDITIPLRQEYVRKMASGTINGHHLVCLLKYNEHVLATKTVPTMPGLLSVKFPDVLQLKNVHADFKITLEIYGMVAQREELPHELKYHINLNKKSGIKTPKKKGGDNRLVMPPVQSPAGPSAVRTPQLVQYGFAIFSLREIQRTTWTLTQVLGVSPLEGIVHMKVNCELSVSVEYKGFLTMFEDISGFGAWHRRWCYLNGSVINYWKYPDDEKKKTPMGSIDLNACVTQKVTTAPRDVCARLNTMLLECQRPAKDTDQESLIIVPNGRTTIVRHLLSADTKEEREEWSAYFNKALTLLRAWGPTQ